MVWLLATMVFFGKGGLEVSRLRPTDLTCEYRYHPLGIEERAPRLGWICLPLSPNDRGLFQTAYQIQVATSAEKLKKDTPDLWDSGKVVSSQMNQIPYAGQPLHSRMECYWRVRVWDQDDQVSEWSPIARWTMGLLDKTDWTAQWIGYDAPFSTEKKDDLILPPPPFLRKEFRLTGKVVKAFLYVSALGSCEVRINGKRVSDDYFIPGWSDFRKRAYYRTYEVTDLLTEGDNAIGAVLIDDWYSGYCGGWGKRDLYGGQPRLRVQLEVQMEDGTVETIATDGSWKATYGPILEADFYHGQTYDSRREMPGWDQPGFDDQQWEPVVVSEDIDLALTSHPGPPVRKVAEIAAKSLSEPQPGLFIYDMGQNMVGVVRLRIRNAPAGTRVQLRFAEMLNPDGTLYTTNLRRARNTDTYICRGDPEEVFEPRFTFRGFRYVEVTGYPGRPSLDAVIGIVFHSDVPMVGDFQCAHPLVNRLIENIRWGLRGNFLEVPTDCPQRDERQGWTGDAQIFAPTAAYLSDIAAFMTKWLIDLNDGQREDGAYPDVAPVTGAGFGTPAWGDAGIVIPYVLYRTYGDTRVIERYYDRMTRYIEYLKANSDGFLRPDIGYGDWVPAGPPTPRDVLATAYFARVTHLMSEMAAAIGKQDDAQAYQQLFDQIAHAFVNAYVSPDGKIKGETQTAYALALDLDLLPEDKRALALHHLVADIEGRGNHLSTGFVGTLHLMSALTKLGRTDVAYRLLLQETYPSWLYMVRMGATTIWERWDSWTEERGFQDPGMNSFNHYAFGSVGEWIFSTVGGIAAEEVAFRRVRIQPQPNGLSPVKARYRSPSGTITVEWTVSNNTFNLMLEIPPNVVASVYLPTESADQVAESGGSALQSPGVRLLRKEGDSIVFEVSSGRYHFTCPLRRP
ncbi:MAG: glycoside hydrolase family 78 protein [Armatimonadetes bacterium]|nr:glycoside hydrolase family 78 protein [Armatimonadota bacterium]MDW8120862.1 family 78 glycoside hydrolase catalytic domain [Armatimonadota bacterium]